jgi:hypothetical protein
MNTNVVANPSMMAKTGILIGGEPSDRVFDDVVDVDATAMYPRIMMAFNIDAAGQIGRLVTVNPDGTDADTDLYMEALASGDPIAVGQQWLELPGLAELADLVLDKNEE